MGQLFVCVLGIIFVVTYGTVGEKDGIGTTKEVETCSVLANRLRDMEKGMYLIRQNIHDQNVKHKEEIDKVKTAIDLQNEINARQREEIVKQNVEIAKQKEEIVKQNIEIDNLKLEHRLEMDKLTDSWKKMEINMANQGRLNEAATDHAPHGENVTSRYQRYLLNANTPIGFTAYLDHNVDHLGIDQTIIFNRVLFNDGGAYNTRSGIFTCPRDGVYLFFFEVGSPTHRQSVVKLVADNRNEVDAIADAEFHSKQDAQGSNMAILSLGQGTHVWVENYRWDDKGVEGSSTDRFSTFSGLLLYHY